MSYGFECIGTNGKTLINDEAVCMHFNTIGTEMSRTYAYATIPGYTGSNNSLHGTNIYTYRFAAATGAQPIVFIKPVNYDEYHGLIYLEFDGTWWNAQVLVSGSQSSSYPKLYTFVAAEHTLFGSDTHGMIVYKSDGLTKTFDSRSMPLNITGAGTIKHRSIMSSAFYGNQPATTTGYTHLADQHVFGHRTNDYDFSNLNSLCPHNTVANSGIDVSNSMFYATASAQSIAIRRMHGKSHDPLRQSTSQFWVMLRGTYRLRAGNIDAGWTSFAAGEHYAASYETGTSWGGGGGTYATNTIPVWGTSATADGEGRGQINTERDQGFLIADSSRYT